jgi:hypothetical protein
MSVQKVGTLVYAYLEVWDSANAPVTGLVDGDFTKRLAVDAVNSAVVVTVAEIGNGRYSATFTPPVNGNWYLSIQNATYNPRGWDETYQVTTDGVVDLSQIANAVWDLAAAIDGYTPRQTLREMGAALCGKVSGMGAGLPVFRSMNDTADRIAATCDSDGNRTAVVLTP